MSCCVGGSGQLDKYSSCSRAGTACWTVERLTRYYSSLEAGLEDAKFLAEKMTSDVSVSENCLGVGVQVSERYMQKSLLYSRRQGTICGCVAGRQFSNLEPATCSLHFINTCTQTWTLTLT
jgi:hypothetical protein